MLQHLLSFLSCPQNGSWSSLSARYTVGKIPTRLSLSPRHKTCFRDSTQLARQKLRRVQAGSRSRGPGRPRRARAGPAGRSGRCGVVSVGGAVDPAEAWSGGGRALAQPCRSLCEDVRGAGEEAVASLSCSLLRLGPLVRMARECADEMGERRGAPGYEVSGSRRRGWRGGGGWLMNPLGSDRAGTPSSLSGERDAWLRSSLKGCLPLRCASLHCKEHLPGGEVCGDCSPGRGPGLEVVCSC